MSILTPAQLQRIRRFQEGGAAVDQPYIEAVTRQDEMMDPITQQLLFGTDGQDGFIPGAFRAAERTFFDSEGRPIVIPQEIAGLSPDQIEAQQLARGAVGVQQPFIQEAMSRGQQGIDALQSGIGGQALASQQALRQIQEGSRFALDQRDRAMMDAIGGTQQGRARALEAEARLRGDLGDITGMAQRSTGQYIDQLGQQAAQGRRATEDFGMDLAKVRQQGQRSYDEFGRDITDAVGMGMISKEDLSRGLSTGEELASAATALQRGRLDLAETGMKGGISQLDRDLTRQLGAESAATGGFGGQIGEARTQLKNTVEDGFNIGDKTSEYFDPYEDKVVQQSIRDASEGLAKQDMAQYARDISSGGESAFGSRARLSAEERAEAMGRGLAREVGGIRSAGFQRAQQTAIGEDERARQAQRAASSGLASLAGQELGAERGLIDRAAQASQQRYGAAQNLAGMQQQRAASELGSVTQLADIYRQGAQQRFGAGQQLAGQVQQAAGQKLAAGQGYGDLIQQTAQAQLSAQQQQNQQMGQQAQQQYGAQQGLGSLMGGAAQQLYGAGTGLGQTLAGYGQQDAAARAAAAQQGMGVAGTLANQYGQIGQQQYGAGQALAGAQAGYGTFLSGLGGQAQQAAMQDVASLQGIGGQAQQQRQRELDAQRAGLLQAQQAPLAQYQALMPFVNMSPTAKSTVQTQYTPPPNALNAGLAAGLGALGTMSNFNNPNSELRPRLTPEPDNLNYMPFTQENRQLRAQ
jgi:hypothetical protein